MDQVKEQLLVAVFTAAKDLSCSLYPGGYGEEMSYNEDDAHRLFGAIYDYEKYVKELPCSA